MADNTVPTPPQRDPADDKKTSTSNYTRPTSSNGHWYSFPGQQNQPAPPPPPTADIRRHSARDRVRRRKVRRDLGAPDDWALVIIAAALLGVTVAMSILVFVWIRATQSTSGTQATSIPALEPTSVIYGPGGILEGTGEVSAGGMLGNGQSMVIHRWDGQERFTVLLMGMDRRPGEMGTAALTDTMILISLDPTSNRVGILSIPRDLYVDVPGYGLQKINTAFRLGEYEGPGGGPLLAMQTVQYNFGIQINEYFMVDFSTFMRVVDEIGGIDVEVAADIYDPQYPDMNYGYDPFYIEAGWHHLDGETALKYARSRHSTDDIDRARRQQQVMYAVRDRVLSLDQLDDLVLNAPVLWSEMDEGIDTGLSLDQVIELAWYIKDIDPANFTNGVLGWEYVYSATLDNGQQVLVPNRFTMSDLMLDVFGPGYNE